MASNLLFPGDFFIGLDIGLVTDFTALTVVHRVKQPPSVNPLDADSDLADEELYELMYGSGYIYEVTDILRFPRGTKHPEIIREVQRLVDNPNLAVATTQGCYGGAETPPLVFVDMTGLGLPIVHAMQNATPPGHVIGVMITGGNEATQPSSDQWNIPKSQLIGKCQFALSDGRLKIRETSRLASVTTRELMAYRVSVSPSGHESFGAPVGEHDDLVLSLALAIFGATHTPYFSAGAF
jgi:hypothetical protein